MLFRVPHSVKYEGGKFKFWYGGGSYFEQGKEKTLLVYEVDINDKTYFFYNGKNYGIDGFGYAELVEE